MGNVKLIATAAFGIESLVADELKYLGYTNIKTDNGKIEFDGTLKDICRSNIWLRCADRVMLKVAEFRAETFDELYENTKKADWSSYIPVDGMFPVSKVTSIKSKLFSKSDCQAIVKKAVVDSMAKRYGQIRFEETGSMYDIRVQILNDIVTIAIDTSGDGLHKRGYRTLINEAPIKETLAAAMVKLSKYRSRGVLFDPMCGTGTIPIEAAMIAKNIAPGSNRAFAAEKWGLIDEKDWLEVRDEAYSLEKNYTDIEIYGSDIDAKTIETARKNLEAAGLEDVVKLSCRSLESWKASEFSGIGKIVTNPPYGERLAEKQEAEQLYKTMGKTFRNRFKEWEYNIITPYEGFENLFGSKSTKNRKLYNGGIKCYFYMYNNSK